MSRSKVLDAVKADLAMMTVIDGHFMPTQFVLSQVSLRTGIERRRVMRVLDRLVKEKDLEVVSDTRKRGAPGESGPARRDTVYRVIRDIRLRRDYQAERITCRDKIWSTIRTLRRTTQSNLVRLTGCTEGVVKDYVVILAKAGHLKCTGKDRHEKVWSLVKDVGPKRPETPVADKKTEPAEVVS
jgi:hypothetical protein